MTSFLDQESIDDKLTKEIFSLLEKKFLFDSQNPDFLDQNLFKSRRKSDVGKVRILSIDGNGSTDGILAAKSLAILEFNLCQKSENPDARIADFFDAGTGSGIGGILVALLFTKGEDDRPLLKASEALEFIVSNRHKLLIPRSSKNGCLGGILFGSSKSNKIFRKMFGELTLKDTVKPVLIPCYDLCTRAPFLFSRTDAMENDSYDFKLNEICAATIANPMVDAFRMSSIDNKTRVVAVDGGVAMNNPTAAAITHVLNNKQEFPFCASMENLLVVSLGNGVTNSVSVPNFIKIGGEVSAEMIDESVSMAFGSYRASNYVRIQGNGFNGKKVVEIAEEMLRQKSVESVLFRGKKLSEKTNSEKLEIFAGVLINEHRRREMSVLPTVMLKNSSSPRSSSSTVSTVCSS